LFYNYFRDYNPVVGGYSKSDPIGLRGGINTYAYVKGGPLMLVDPDGLRWTDGTDQGARMADVPGRPSPPPPSGVSSSALTCSCDEKNKITLRCFFISVDFTVPQSVPKGGWSVSWIGVGPTGFGGKAQLVKVCKCVADEGWYVGAKGSGSIGVGPLGVEASGTIQFYPAGYQGSVSGGSSSSGYAIPGLSGQIGIGR
jgi:hypothetical protein